MNRPPSRYIDSNAAHEKCERGLTELLLLVAGIAIGVLAVYVTVRPSRPTAAAELDPPASAPAAAGARPQLWELLDQIDEGVLILDHRLRPTLANAAASRILGVQGDRLPARLPSEEVVVVARRSQRDGAEIEELLNLWYPRRSTIKARALPVPGSSDLLIVLQDVSEELLSQKIRTEFVAHASHELKSPVAGLQALAEAVQQAADDDPKAVERFAGKMVAEAGRLARLITDLLDLSRLEEAGQIPDEPTDLSAVAHREVTQVGAMAEAKGMQLEVQIQEQIWVRGDDQQLSLMIGNLLENAIRYTPEGGHVRLELTIVGPDAALSVVDTGIGIPLEAQGRVFERFFRVDRARSRARGGTGLGLAIVKHVAELHGGEVSVQSELGRGSTFTARIPALQPEQIAALAG